MRVIFGKVLCLALTLFCVTLSTGNLAFAIHTHTPPSSGSDSSSADTGSTPKVADSHTPPSAGSSDKSGDGSGSSPSGSVGDDIQGSQGTSPNPPTPPLTPTKCPDGSTPDKDGKCPTTPTPPPPTPCPSGTQADKTGKCVPSPIPCPKGTELDKTGKCVPILCPEGSVLVDGRCQPHCHLIRNGTEVLCIRPGQSHTTVIEHNTVQQVPLTANTNNINLVIVTTCTADQNNGVLNGNLAALCDSTITMMHNYGLNSQLPQVDMYLKARGLLQ